MDPVQALLAPADVDRLRDALGAAGYTSTGIAARIGPAAVEAVRRNDFRALLRATTDRDRLAHPDPAVPRRPDRARRRGRRPPWPRWRSTTAVRPVWSNRTATGCTPASTSTSTPATPGEDWWVLSDLDADVRPGPLRTDHVLGVGNAATTLADATIRRPVATALDLGTGCGVQALQLSTHADTVTATDLSERALRFAATTAALNGHVLGTARRRPGRRRYGAAVRPRGEQPAVRGRARRPPATRTATRVGPATRSAPSWPRRPRTCSPRAAPCSSWPTGCTSSGEDWRERVAGWVAGTGCDAWIVQREVSDPVEYVQPVAARRRPRRSTRPGRRPGWTGSTRNKIEARRASAW